MIDLDELRSVQSRERQTDSLQQLRESFYQDAGEFIQQLHRERERAADQADDPWDAPEVNRLSDDIDTAEQTVEAIYERRVGKIVKIASLAAADMPTEDEGLTAEERDLFDSLVASIEQNRANVEAVIEGEDPPHAAADAGPTPTHAETTRPGDAAPGGSHDPSPDTATGPSSDEPHSDVPTDTDAPTDDTSPTPPAGADGGPAGPAAESDSGIDAADLMGGVGPDPSDSGPASPRSDEERSPERGQPPQADGGTDTVADTGAEVGTEAATGPGPADLRTNPSDETPLSESESESDPDPDPDPSTSTEPPTTGSGTPRSESTAGDSDRGVDRVTVKITSDVGEIFGVDQRSYDLSTDDVVRLPEANAGPLVERDAADRLD